MKVLHIGLVACALALSASAAGASDVNFGSYARSVAMGGAGLALADDVVTASTINPAAGAASGVRLGFIFPTVDLHARGASIDDFTSHLGDVGDSSSDEAISLAEDFGKQRTSLTMGMMAGVAGPLGVTAEGEAQGIINPGPAFQQWVLAGHPYTADGLFAAGLIPDTSATSLTNYASTFTAGTYVGGRLIYDVPAVSLSMGFGGEYGKLWVGTKLKRLHSEVHNWMIAASPDTTTGSLTLDAIEAPALEDEGFAADVGFILQPAGSNVQYGAVINNFVDADLAGIESGAMLSLGVASQVNPYLLVAADLVNINKAYNGNPKLRVGAEFALTRKLAVRAGYTGSDFTVGFGIFGVNFAFASDAPYVISRTLRF